MSFQSVIYSQPNFVVNNASAASQARNNIVAPWATVAHYPSTINLGSSSQTLYPERTVSGKFYIAPSSDAAVNIKLPDAASWYRFLSTRSIPGYENISDGDMFVFEMMINGQGAKVNVLPGTGGAGTYHPFYNTTGTTGAQCECFPVQWRVTSTGTWYNLL